MRCPETTLRRQKASGRRRCFHQ